MAYNFFAPDHRRQAGKLGAVLEVCLCQLSVAGEKEACVPGMAQNLWGENPHARFSPCRLCAPRPGSDHVKCLYSDGKNFGMRQVFALE